jgi:acetylornithine deacetylase/succinyl-diaminopimelate desuccinylase-like protein
MRAFGFEDVKVLIPVEHPTKGNVVIRLHGKGLGKPILYIGHLDVVDAKREDWTVDPFQVTEKDGYLYGRGVMDMKGDDAAMLESLIRMKREGYVPDRDIIVALTADEEAEGDANGVEWLLKNHRDAVNATLVFNPDAGGGQLKNGKHATYGVQTSEKLYVTYTLETTNRGGHSSAPRKDNAIYELMHALLKLEAYRFPVHLTETTRLYFAKSAQFETGQRRADMLAVAHDPPDLAAAERLSANVGDNAHLRTTGVATMMAAGEAENALPQRARATFQCRLIPGETSDETRKRIVDVIADPGVKVTLTEPDRPSGESHLPPQLLHRYETVLHSMWPEVVVLPTMDTGGSDSVFTREVGLPSFGTSAIFSDGVLTGIHGRDERARTVNFLEAVEFTYRLMKAVSSR